MGDACVVVLVLRQRELSLPAQIIENNHVSITPIYAPSWIIEFEIMFHKEYYCSSIGILSFLTGKETQKAY